jgi:xanthine dehydrogenase YagT iron-sulfur-binding subunit
MSAIRIQLVVNDRPLTPSLDPRSTLLDLLRDHLGLTGARRGCDRGDCGTCTVLVDGRPTLACLALAAAQDGRAVTTIEGLAGAAGPHPLQQAFVEHDALQCGFCTPGQILAGVACLAAGAAGSDESVREWMSGNLCRCAAYPQIVAAIRAVAGAG